ncbi:hypothetical protein [Oceanobacillus rekensis]|nr:hypothetical protein [Oceanobacillus rekensis]
MEFVDILILGQIPVEDLVFSEKITLPWYNNNHYYNKGIFYE